MKMRINHQVDFPEAQEAILKIEAFVKRNRLDPILYELIKIRASQLNGCAHCVDVHVKEALRLGDDARRLHLISMWQETPFFTEKEKVVLELTEAVTNIGEAGVPQSLYEKVLQHFDEKEFVTLVMGINAINCWNRISISVGMFPGCKDPK